MPIALLALTLIMAGATPATPIAECQMVRPTWCLEKSAVMVEAVRGGWEISASYFDGKSIQIEEHGQCNSSAKSDPILEIDRSIHAGHREGAEELVFRVSARGTCWLRIIVPDTRPGQMSLYKSVALTSIRICYDNKCNGRRLASFALRR